MSSSLSPSRYFTGLPCRKGHIAERFSGNRECVECSRLRSRLDPKKAARTKASTQRNREKRRLAAQAAYWADLEKSRAFHRSRRILFPEKFKAREEEQRRKHAVERAAKAAFRRAAQLRATPAWADRDKIKEFYAQARTLTLATGIAHEVDHVIPLQAKTCCGLHVETNLQILTKSENSRKQNAMIDKVLESK